MTGEFSKLLLDLYRGSRRIEPEAFQEWLFATLAQVIPLDGGTWISGVQKGVLPPMHSHYLYRFPETLITDYLQVWQQDPLHHALEASSGETFNYSSASYVGVPDVQEFMQKYRVRAVLATRIFDPLSSLRTVITISRSGPKAVFTETERQFMEALAPHLIEVWTVNRLTYALKRNDAGRAPVMATATGVADSNGILHLAEDYFNELLCLEWPDWSGPRLPDRLRTPVLWGEAPTYLGDRIVVTRIGKMHDQFLLRARLKVNYDSLGEREKEVARLVSEGLSQKEIARKCDISPATVNNHLARIYQKLGIGDKAQLAKVMSQFE